MSFHTYSAGELKQLEKDGRKRAFPKFFKCHGPFLVQDQTYLNLCSNDYLGLGNDPKIFREFLKRIDGCNPAASAENSGSQVRWKNVEFPTAPDRSLAGMSSRLLTGNHPAYTALENLLAGKYHREGALVFNSGYHANIGILPALAGKGDIIFSDKLNHASIIDGMRLSEAEWVRYHHLDLNHLETLLRKRRGNFRNAFIVSETVFSMDGDVADLTGLVRLKEEFDATLIIDEAHAFGVFGPCGLGVAEASGLTDRIDVLIGTFGKAAGSIGAFCVTDTVIRDYLINHARSLIFTTALPAMNLRWTFYVLDEVFPGCGEKRKNLLSLAGIFRDNLRQAGLETRGDSQIVPVILGDNNAAVAAAEQLKQQDYWAMPIRPPTVPPGTARLRLSLTADMNIEMLADIPEILKKRKTSS